MKKISKNSNLYLPLTFAIVLFCLLFFGCRKELVNNIDAEFQPFVDLFFEEAIAREYIESGEEKPLDIQFAAGDDLPSETTRAICSGFGEHEIRINKNYWDEMHSIEKELLISHEIGHCLLSRPHLEVIVNDCNCSSMMYPGVTGFDCIADLQSPTWRKFYYDELFDTDATIPSKISNNDFSTWNRLLLNTFADTIPEVIDIDDDVSYELIFSFKNSNIVNLVSKHFDLNVDFHDSNFLENVRYRLSIDDLHFNYGIEQEVSIEKPFEIRLILNDQFIYIFVDDFLLHSFDIEDRSFENTMLLSEMENLESFTLYELKS